MENKTPQEEIASGLNSTNIKNNADIPFADDFIELDHVVPDEPIRPKRSKDLGRPIEKSSELKDNVAPIKIHAKDIGPVHTSPDNDTIVVSTPEGTLYITLTDPPKKNATLSDTPTNETQSPSLSNKLASPCTESTSISIDDDVQPDTSKAEGAEESKALIDKEVEMAQRRAGLRRNSISMPTLQNLEMEVIKQHYLDDPNEIPEHHASTTSFGEERARDTLSDDDQPKTPLRSPRKKGISLRRLGRSEFSMDEDEYSPSNSVTSINSLASLLREKIQSIPQKIRKKPTDYKLRAFVGLMFLAVAFFIGFAYVLYHRQALSKAYFDNVQFNEPKRLLRVLNQDDVEILKANLAVGIPAKSKSYPCLLEHRKSDGSICLEWLHMLRFYLKSLPHDSTLGNTTCYSIHWKALNSDVSPNDCFDCSDTKMHWYGAGQSINLTWPLNRGSLDYTAFITGDMHKPQWGNVLSRYLINSKGAAILIDDDSPVHISINRDKKEICMKAKHDDFAYANRFTDFAEMRYNICVSHDMIALHSALHSHQNNPLWDGLRPEDMDTLKSLMSEPIWEIAPRFKEELTAETLADYTEDVILLGFLKQGHVLINEFWQKEIGDFKVDTKRFETLNTTLDKLRRRGFKVTFTIQPFISTESESFSECVQKRLLVSERNSDYRIPALTRFKSLASAGVLDITNANSIPWIKERLDSIVDKYKIDSFYLDLGTAYDMPHYYRCEKRIVNPDQYKLFFTKTFKEYYKVIGVSSAVSLPKPPTFVSLPPFESSWEALRRVIPTMLTYGISGYPFLMPGAVGGDIHWTGGEQFLPTDKGTFEGNSTEYPQDNHTALPEPELYIRWLQLATFLPVIKFTHLPKDKRVLEIAKNLTALRQKTITPLFLKYQRDALDDGLPLVRPLWLVTGGGDAVLSLQDEFAIGDELIVAPILNKGQTARDVYLPAGQWRDGIDGSYHKGNRWVHDHKVPLDRVAYFLRQPNDRRFR